MTHAESVESTVDCSGWVVPRDNRYHSRTSGETLSSESGSPQQLQRSISDEMAQMIDIAKEFGYSIRSFHHGVEAYKIADLLARENISGSLWADWGGFKMEAMDGVKSNLALVHKA